MTHGGPCGPPKERLPSGRYRISEDSLEPSHTGAAHSRYKGQPVNVALRASQTQKEGTQP